jgi:malonyl-CoA/methylmalonyl-CoA synthetase
VERYGMTEIGSVLSIPLNGERRPGYVGVPSPGVRMRIVHFLPSPHGAKAHYDVLAEFDSRSLKTERPEDGVTGELLIKGPNVFRGYWNRPEATDKDFTRDGWFRTGDVVSFSGGYIKILGRSSADIIKSGGYKISALEIETHLLGHPLIQDCTVVGIPDHTWGQRVRNWLTWFFFIFKRSTVNYPGNYFLKQLL